MEFRSTNDNGYVHFQGDVVSNVSSGQAINSSHGVHLTGGSTGGIVQPSGDESNIALRVRPKGSGPLILGSSLASIQFGGDSTNSTTAFSAIQRFRIDATVPALSSAGAAGASAESTVTLASATTNAIYIIQDRVQLNSSLATGIFVRPRCGTAAELNLTFYNVGASTISGSTMSWYLLQFSF